MSDSSFTTRTLYESDTHTVRLIVSGELDIATEPQLIAAVSAAVITDGAAGLVVDLTGVPFIDSAGLRALLLSRTAAEERGLTFELAVHPGPVTRLLDIAGVTNWFSYATAP